MSDGASTLPVANIVNLPNMVVRHIEVYENERYIPLSGWSSKGLLISDRSAYSTKVSDINIITAMQKRAHPQTYHM